MLALRGDFQSFTEEVKHSGSGVTDIIEQDDLRVSLRPKFSWKISHCKLREMISLTKL